MTDKQMELDKLQGRIYACADTIETMQMKMNTGHGTVCRFELDTLEATLEDLMKEYGALLKS